MVSYSDIKTNLRLNKMNNYEGNVKTLLYIFIVFIFAISILLVINSTYNLILILIDTDKYIYESDYKKYKSIRDLLGYKILMNSYKSGYTSTSEYYNDTYLTLNTNAFLLRLTMFITVSSLIIFALLTFLSYMLNNTEISTNLSTIKDGNFELIITCFALLLLLIIFNVTNKATINGYKADRLDVKGTAENNFIKNYLIQYNDIVTKIGSSKDPVKISDIKGAIKDDDKDKIFESILNKLKYLDKYSIVHELSPAEIHKIEKAVTDVKAATDIDKANDTLNTAIGKKVETPSAQTPTADQADQLKDIEVKNDKRILMYCYYFTVVNKDNDVDPVKLIYEFIKKVKQILLEKDIDKYYQDVLDVHRNLMGLGEEFSFLFAKIIPTFLVSSYNDKEDNKNILDDKYENLFIESLYTCDYIGVPNKVVVDDIKEKMDKAKEEKKAILISIVVIFIIALIVIFLYLNRANMTKYYYWTYLDNIKKDAGRVTGPANYLFNLRKFNSIVKPNT
jgi:hypothetical protein